MQRQAMKAMLRGWDKQFPGRLETIFASLQNVAPSQLADRQLFDFAGLMRNPQGSSQVEEQVMSFIARDGVYAASQSGTGAANAGLDVLAQ
jgi:tRNA 2-thiocytidine biosynthesis protein TtcA